MKRAVQFTLGSVNPDSSNGINRVVESITRFGNGLPDWEVTALTVRQRSNAPKREIIQRDGFEVVACNSTQEAQRWLDENSSRVDLLHFHNVWSVPNIRLGRQARKFDIPYVVTPYAAFLSDRLSQKYAAKVVFSALVQKTFLDNASAVFAVARDEIHSISKFTKSNTIYYVPNCSSAIEQMPTPRLNEQKDKLRIGYLGRISREKNVLALVDAAGELLPRYEGLFEIVVYGPNNNSYARRCIEKRDTLGLKDVVSFPGAVSASEKFDALRGLDAYVHPVLSDATPLSALEAISQRLPIIASRTSGMAYWAEEAFFFMVEPVSTDIARGIESLMAARDCIGELGNQAGEYYSKTFSPEIVLADMYKIYESVIK